MGIAIANAIANAMPLLLLLLCASSLSDSVVTPCFVLIRSCVQFVGSLRTQDARLQLNESAFMPLRSAAVLGKQAPTRPQF